MGRGNYIVVIFGFAHDEFLKTHLKKFKELPNIGKCSFFD